MQLQTLELLYTMRGSPTSFFSMTALQKGWMLVVITVIFWAIPIAMSFPSSAMTVMYRNLSDMSLVQERGRLYWTYRSSSATVCQLSGRLISGFGQAGQLTQSSPGRVFAIPIGLCPRPARFSIFRWRHCRIMRRNGRRRSCAHVQIKDIKDNYLRTYVGPAPV